MPDGPLLTIAMPVFNGGPHLRMAVLSIVQQSFTDWELLLIDDGSTDGAIEELADLADSRIHVIRDGRNRGLAARLNEALGLARGCYFARMDADDISHPERFSQQLAVLKSDQSVDLLGSRCMTISTHNEILGTLPFKESHRDICSRPWLGFYLPHPTWVGKTAWFRTHHYAEPGPYCCEDQELLLRAHYSSHFHALSDILLAYRLRDRLVWRKACRTRVTLFRIQFNHFVTRKNYAFAVLATVATVLRLGRDFLTFLRQFRTGAARSSAGVLSVGSEEAEHWQRWIRRLEGRNT
ncbi:MAG: putative glycosyltransferase EpsE [Proteobacteria bacterium]|nr:putative glycosyltransferase EpsE [Pseudomonadota bacterium]